MSNNKIKTIFIGTPDFGIPCLKALVKDQMFDVAAVITQPDKPAGRKQKMTAPAIKKEAKKYDLPIFQPAQITNVKCQMTNIDLMVVVAYAQIIPKKILEAPKYGCINVHGSLLPKYRGASCIQAAILNGNKNTGITIMKMDENLDTGPIIAQKGIAIANNDTAGTLFDKLSVLGGELLIPALRDYINGKISPLPQDNSSSSYAPKITKNDGHIDWSKPAVEIERQMRAMNPWPGAFGKLRMTNDDFRIIKIHETGQKPLSINDHKPGTLFLDDGKLAIQCGEGALEIKKLQVEGRKVVTAEEFINGNSNLIGQILG